MNQKENWKTMLLVKKQEVGDNTPFVKIVVGIPPFDEDFESFGFDRYCEGYTFEAATLDHEAMTRPFDSGLGGIEGFAFVAWTEERVYFPAVYDGAEWVDSVPRHPVPFAVGHIGG